MSRSMGAGEHSQSRLRLGAPIVACGHWPVAWAACGSETMANSGCSWPADESALAVEGRRAGALQTGRPALGLIEPDAKANRD